MFPVSAGRAQGSPPGTTWGSRVLMPLLQTLRNSRCVLQTAAVACPDPFPPGITVFPAMDYGGLAGPRKRARTIRPPFFKGGRCRRR